MKKILILMLITMVFTLTACEKNNRIEETEQKESLQTEQTSEIFIVNSEEEETETSEAETSEAETSGTEISDNVDKIPEAYTKLLTLYSTALTERWNGEKLIKNDLNYMLFDCYGDSPFQNIGYAIKDLDGNGSLELIIGTTANVSDDFYGKLILELYTSDENGNLTKIFSSGERDRYYYAGTNLFANLGSSGASDSIDTTMKLENGALIDLGMITEPSNYIQMGLTEMSKQQAAVTEESSSSLQLPILDEINQNTTVGTTGSFMTAVQSAVKLLDWGVATGLDPEEIKAATVAWMTDKGNDEQVAFAEKMALVDEAYQKLLGEDAQQLLSSAGCEDAAYPWSNAPVESIEAIMEAVGLR